MYAGLPSAKAHTRRLVEHMKGAATGRVPWSNRGVHRVCQQARCHQWLTSRLSDGVHVAVRRIHIP